MAEWREVVVEYTIPQGSSLIGQQFTWGADDVIPDDSFYGAWDAVTVIPEPSSLALVLIVGLTACRVRKRFHVTG